jgi:hypothetical protein
MSFRTGRMSPAAFAAHIKARTSAESTPLPVSSVTEIDPAVRLAEVVTRARALPLPDGHEMAVFAVGTFKKLLPAEGETLAVATLVPLSGALRQLGTCHRILGNYEAEKACASVRDLADTVYRILAP